MGLATPPGTAMGASMEAASDLLRLRLLFDWKQMARLRKPRT